MSADKSMLDRLMAIPHKELVDDAIFYHDSWIAAGRERNELKAENAKLRKERDHWHVEQVHAYGNWEDVHKRVIELEAENAKLRELADILCFCMQIHKQCDDCKLNGAKGDMAHDPLLACDALHAMLRELGIEVDE